MAHLIGLRAATAAGAHISTYRGMSCFCRVIGFRVLGLTFRVLGLGFRVYRV